jgi:Protein of unknown function (DUF2855)
MTTATILSFATNKNTRLSVELVETKAVVTDEGITFAIVQIGLSANNKFYLDFGEKAPFNFDKCYPIDPAKSTLLFSDDDDDGDQKKKKIEDYVHPPAWGLCKVTSSSVDGVSIGSHYLAQLPMAESVSFPGGTVDDEGNLLIHRPTTVAAYNLFQKVSPTDALLSKQYGALALVCFPGILTGYGLYFDLERHGYYGGAKNVVITSASSKVGLALALYLKEKKSGKKVIGYTSDANRDFCKTTGLYDVILGYNDKLCDNNVVPKDESCVIVDISGNASVWSNNTAPSSTTTNIAKLLVIGNSSGAPDEKSTFAHLSLYAKVKMMLTMFGAPLWMRSWMNPTQELFLIMDIAAALRDEWGLEKFNATKQEYAQTFCQHAINWIKVRDCPTVGSIHNAFQHIVQGTVPPSEAIVMDVAKVVLPLKAKS